MRLSDIYYLNRNSFIGSGSDRQIPRIRWSHPFLRPPSSSQQYTQMPVNQSVESVSVETQASKGRNLGRMTLVILLTLLTLGVLWIVGYRETLNYLKGKDALEAHSNPAQKRAPPRLNTFGQMLAAAQNLPVYSPQVPQNHRNELAEIAARARFADKDHDARHASLVDEDLESVVSVNSEILEIWYPGEWEQ